MPCSCRHLNITASDVENLTNHSNNKMTINPPKQAKVVICGAGGESVQPIPVLCFFKKLTHRTHTNIALF